MTDTTFYKGYISKEDIEFGTGVFNRLTSTGGTASKTQINKSHIPRKVVIKIADFTIGAEYGEFAFNNQGDTATMTYTLPVAKAGMGPYHFTVLAAYEMKVDPNGTELFRDCAAGKYKSTAIVGNRLSVWCDINGVWEYDYELVSGDWTNEA